MKKHDILKTVQLLIYVILAVLSIIKLLLDKEIYHKIAADPGTHLLFLFLWALFAISFIFIFIDFSLSAAFKKDFRELDYAVHSDPLSGLSNRNGCDALIDKYSDKPLPSNIGCVMLELSNIREINELFGHKAGNQLIQEYANILNRSSQGLCFVGRNGGNKFLAIFEDATHDKIKSFLDQIEAQVIQYNQSTMKSSIKYRYGIAFEESSEITKITELVALSNRRINSDK